MGIKLHLYQVNRGQNSEQINITKHVSKYLIYGAKMPDKCVKSQKKILYIVIFCKVKLSKMASIKSNKIKKTNSTFLIQIFMIYNFAFGPVEIPHL